MPVVAGIGEAAGVAASVAVSDECCRRYRRGGIKGNDSFRDTGELDFVKNGPLFESPKDSCYLVIVADLTSSPLAERILIQYIPLLSAVLTLIRCLPAGINPFTGASTVFPVIS
jgi:hypothetical protein